jgi:hypothetical protein
VSMFNKPIDTINEHDLQQLIDDLVCESQSLEFKQRINLDEREAKYEFLRDVSAFANATGGDIIIGLGEKDGAPSEIAPLQGINADDFALRISHLCSQGLTPPLSSVRVQPVIVTKGGTVFVLRIPQSWNRTHMLREKQEFWVRTGPGKRRMDYAEIRRGILESEIQINEFKRFRMTRIEDLSIDNGPFPLASRTKWIFHVIPAQAFSFGNVLDLGYVRYDDFRLADGHAPRRGCNFDGLIVSNPVGDRVDSYTQFFRNGVIEYVTSKQIEVEGRKGGRPGNTIYDPKDLIRTSIQQALRCYATLNIAPPFFFCASMINVKGFRIFQGLESSDVSTPPYRNNLIFPELEITSEDVDEVVKQSLKLIYQSFGLPRYSP